MSRQFKRSAGPIKNSLIIELTSICVQPLGKEKKKKRPTLVKINHEHNVGLF